MDKYGLVGKNISYSFSRGYFTEKFARLGLENVTYENYDLQEIGEIESVFKNEVGLKGLNVTIPYKEEVIPFLNELHPVAEEIGAVNTIAFQGDIRIGHNTDAIGFKASLIPMLPDNCKQALILGTGGASKAIRHVLTELEIAYTIVSRQPEEGMYSYDELDKEIIAANLLIVNSTPLGTYPNIGLRPEIPYDGIGERHCLFDLVYNPAKTAFLTEGEKRGARIANGLRMLELQAEASWNIWQNT